MTRSSAAREVTGTGARWEHGRTGRFVRSRVRRVTAAVHGAVLLLVALPGSAVAETVPRRIPADSTSLDRKWMPAFDYDGDGCYPSVAVGPDGTVNSGLDNSGALDGQCHDLSDLENSNVYARSESNHGWQAHLYDVYFQKDQAVPGFDVFGHRHDIEHVVVWVHEGRARYVSTSAHGEYDVHPASAVDWHEGTHAKVVYHKDGVGTHAFRLAGEDEQPENDLGDWHYPALVSWERFPGDTRSVLSEADFGHAAFAITDGAFRDNLAAAEPAGIPFDPSL
ncbi:NPP1 family protein [Actinopolyspora mortivallis]|uniref:NPP1 family protein n=1 Tax=Actinopolyspora mortivallis TaxID=33906 RepID=UPI00036EA1E8|nr:NPP1 family protein [Actinopolyspora mortivallis]